MVVRKKRGRKPGVKIGSYKTEIQKATQALKILIRKRINVLNKLLKELN